MSAADVLVVANPRAGRGRARRTLDIALPVLRAAGLRAEVLETDRPGHAEELARHVDPLPDRLAVAGGDGTVHEVVNGLLSRADDRLPAIGVLPAGTGDALAFDLGIGDPETAARVLAAGVRRRIDLARVTVDGAVRHAFSVVGWGAFARINRRAERFRALGRFRYDVATVVELARPRLRSSRARLDGAPEDGMLLGVACLTAYTGRGIHIAPDAVLDDGLADVVEVRRGGRWALARLFAHMQRGTHAGSHLVRIERRARLELELDPGSWVVLDGEALPARSVALEVVPRRLEVFAPDP